MLRCSCHRESVRSLDCGRAERSLDLDEQRVDRRLGCRGKEKRLDCESATTEETTGDWAAILPCTTREEKTEEEMNGEDTTPCTTGEERVIRKGKEEMRR
ncbi:hypothetical protein DY000_02031694 [Brassica cretica]|uniref:Uncharacterized protein n=1 Tax=Brassica cretica TaxID=69181 RepID=A0ABQ7DPX4_BRACR|nr:hypothetical protein DY000_02031694 [Brassica cretica]